MKIAYNPQIFPLPKEVKPVLIGGAFRCFCVVDDKNMIYMKNSFIKPKEEDKATGVQTVSGDELFNGKILAIGGKYRNCWAIIE